MPNIMKAVQFMIVTANDYTHGYDQTHRNGSYYDCSSLVRTALHEAGKWGNGNTRKQKLTGAGYDYSAIQKLVNEMLAKGNTCLT